MTILFDKGCAPHGRFKPKEERAKPAGDSKKGHKLHGDRIDYGQSADRRERPYAGTGKPNSIVGDRCLPDHGRYMFKPSGSYP